MPADRDIAAAIEAIKKGDLAELSPLLREDPNLANTPDAEKGYPPLYWAGMYGYSGRTLKHRPVVDCLLKAGAVVDIHAAAYLDMPERAQEWVRKAPACVRETDRNGLTALHHAAERGSLIVARLLLEAGADPNARTPGGQCPADLSCHPGPWKTQAADDVTQLLLDYGANVDIYLAASMGDLNRIQSCLSEDPSSRDLRDREGSTPLFYAAKDLHLQAVQLLLQAGADPNARRQDGQTPISTAVLPMCDTGGKAVTKALLQAGAIPEPEDARKLGLDF